VYETKRLVTVAAILVLLLAPVAFTGVTPVEAAAASIFFQAASPDASGYPVGGAVKINVKYKWEALTANTTISFDLWNSTDKLETLNSTSIVVKTNDATTKTGTKTGQLTPTSELTEEVGTETYSLKMMSGGLVVDTASIVIIVASSQVTMSVTWQDQNNDRIVDVNELVTFTAYVNWAFVEATEAHSLYVNYGEGEKLLSTVSVTAGSGSETVTDSYGYSSTGSKTATFTLKDATGTTVATRTASLTVGAATPPTTTPAQTSIVGMVTANWQYLAIAAAVIVVGYVYMGKGEIKRKK
jgi:hypothetical protein